MTATDATLKFLVTPFLTVLNGCEKDLYLGLNFKPWMLLPLSLIRIPNSKYKSLSLIRMSKRGRGIDSGFLFCIHNQIRYKYTVRLPYPPTMQQMKKARRPPYIGSICSRCSLLVFLFLHRSIAGTVWLAFAPQVHQILFQKDWILHPLYLIDWLPPWS